MTPLSVPIASKFPEGLHSMEEKKSWFGYFGDLQSSFTLSSSYLRLYIVFPKTIAI